MLPTPVRFHLKTTGLSVAFVLALCVSAVAQQFSESNSTSTLTPQPGAEATADLNTPVFNPTPDSNLHTTTDRSSEVSSEARRFQYGFQITTRGVYDDNINISQTNKETDYYFAIEPVLTLGAGDINGHEENYIRLDYAPSLFLFLDHSEHNALQHLIHLGGQHRFSRLTLAFNEEIAILDGTDLRSLSDQTSPGSHVNLDVSGRTKFQTYYTQLNASYDLSGKTFLTAGINSLITDYSSSSLFSSGDVSGNLFMNYRYSDKLVVGVGGTGGYNFVQHPNPDETFEQANARLTYRATGKLNFNLSGGVEFRQFQQSSLDTYVSPVFELSANYEPADGTTFTLSGTRRTYNSAVLGGQDFAATTITASLRQRFLQRFYLGVTGGYENSDYFSTVSTTTANRVDDYYFIEPSIDFSITRFWTFGAYYLHRQNDSSQRSFSFDDNQVGIRTALLF
jgi:Putative beta-barrel porin 2